MNRRLRAYAYAGLLVIVPAAGRTDDRWETSSFTTDDGPNSTNNELVHGLVQQHHDLEHGANPPDQDWMKLRPQARHSYEARVSSGTTPWETPANSCTYCATFNRVDGNGVVLTAGIADGVFNSLYLLPATVAVRWIAGPSTTMFGSDFLRVEGKSNSSGADNYDVVLYDTTYFLPRFNNSGTQVTVLLIQNTKDLPVTGEIYFASGTGALLSTQPLNIPPHGVQVLSSATVPALAGQSGSVSIAQLGGYGALAGKGVSLEPATGFTFDTALTPLPR